MDKTELETSTGANIINLIMDTEEDSDKNEPQSSDSPICSMEQCLDQQTENLSGSLNTPTVIMNNENYTSKKLDKFKRKMDNTVYIDDTSDRETSPKQFKVDWDKIHQLHENIRRAYRIKPSIAVSRQTRKDVNRAAQARSRARKKEEHLETCRKMANLKQENGDLKTREEKLPYLLREGYNKFEIAVKRFDVCDLLIKNIVNILKQAIATGSGDRMENLSINTRNQNENLSLVPYKAPSSIDTPTRFMNECEQVGLFQDLSKVNPFDATFQKALEGTDTSQKSVNTSEDSLNTPVILLENNNTHTTIDENSSGPSSPGVTTRTKKYSYRELNRASKRKSRALKKLEDQEYEREMENLNQRNLELNLRYKEVYSEMRKVLFRIKFMTESHWRCDTCHLSVIDLCHELINLNNFFQTGIKNVCKADLGTIIYTSDPNPAKIVFLPLPDGSFQILLPPGLRSETDSNFGAYTDSSKIVSSTTVSDVKKILPKGKDFNIKQELDPFPNKIDVDLSNWDLKGVNFKINKGLLLHNSTDNRNNIIDTKDCTKGILKKEDSGKAVKASPKTISFTNEVTVFEFPQVKIEGGWNESLIEYSKNLKD